MREIKFRLWDKTNKKIVYSKGDPFYDNLCLGLDGKIYSVGDSSGDGGWCYEDDHHVNPMQFTGEFDKNGVEIYEGDIVELGIPKKSPKKILRVTVKFNKGTFFPATLFKNHWKVIGDIYQNPELIQ
jgi:uncharacterized phage protein (TIGR01671 family)